MIHVLIGNNLEYISIYCDITNKRTLGSSDPLHEHVHRLTSTKNRDVQPCKSLQQAISDFSEFNSKPVTVHSTFTLESHQELFI